MYSANLKVHIRSLEEFRSYLLDGENNKVDCSEEYKSTFYLIQKLHEDSKLVQKTF